MSDFGKRLCLIAGVALGSGGCSTITSEDNLVGQQVSNVSAVLTGIPVTVQQPATIQIGTKSPRSVAAGEVVYVPEPARVEAEGYYPMFVIPAQQADTKIELKLLSLPVGPGGKTANGNNLDALLNGVLSVQELLAKKQSGSARTEIDKLATAWGELVFFDYLRASAYILDRDYEKALGVVQGALKKEPKNEQLRSLDAYVRAQSAR